MIRLTCSRPRWLTMTRPLRAFSVTVASTTNGLKPIAAPPVQAKCSSIQHAQTVRTLFRCFCVGWMSLAIMVLRVFARWHQLQILGTVIKLVSVFVMDKFKAPKAPPQRTLNDIPMLKDAAPAGNGYLSIAVFQGARPASGERPRRTRCIAIPSQRVVVMPAQVFLAKLLGTAGDGTETRPCHYPSILQDCP